MKHKVSRKIFNVCVNVLLLKKVLLLISPVKQTKGKVFLNFLLLPALL